MLAWLHRLRRKARRYWWWILVLLILKTLEDRIAGIVNKWIDDQSGVALVSLRDFINWSTKDTLGIAGILMVGTFILFMFLSYFQKDENGSTESAKPRKPDSVNLFTLDRVTIAVVMVVIGGLIGYELGRDSKQLRGFLQMDRMFVSGPPLLTVGVRNSFTVIYQNRGTAPVTGAGQVTMMSYSPAEKDQDLDTVVFNQAKEFARMKKQELSDREGATVGIGHTLVQTMEIDFTDSDIKALMDGSATLYIVGHAYWNEFPGQFDLCFKLKPPQYYPLKPSDIVWRQCDRKKVNR